MYGYGRCFSRSHNIIQLKTNNAHLRINIWTNFGSMDLRTSSKDDLRYNEQSASCSPNTRSSGTFVGETGMCWKKTKPKPNSKI